jgi:hypothetical protein
MVRDTIVIRTACIFGVRRAPGCCAGNFVSLPLRNNISTFFSRSPFECIATLLSRTDGVLELFVGVRNDCCVCQSYYSHRNTNDILTVVGCRLSVVGCRSLVVDRSLFVVSSWYWCLSGGVEDKEAEVNSAKGSLYAWPAAKQR